MYDDNDKPEKGLARRTARNLLKKAQIATFPILLKDIAKTIPDLTIEGKELEDVISGAQITYKGKAFILYNAGHSNNRNRFTVAHEIGHLLLGHTSGCNRSNGGSPKEVEANQFAAELLMPLALIKEAIKIHTSITALRRHCWVSKDAMTNRIMEMNLYSKLSSFE